MALSGAINVGSNACGLVRSAPGSVKALWFDAHGDATATQDTTITPLSVTQAGARWINLGEGVNQLHLRLVVPTGDTITTPPSVVVWGLDTKVDPESTSAPTGIPRELLASVALSSTVEVTDATLDYCVPNETVTDLKGCEAILVVISATATLETTGTIQGCLLN